jgi:predicted ATP-grasp superfamily ATP-dependent carboligase
MSRFEPTVVLLGVDRLIGLQLARILWQRGVPVVGVALNPRAHYCRTRAVTKVLAMEDFEADPVAALAELSAGSGREADSRPILIPCLDELVWWLAERREELAPHADFLLSSTDCLERLADKAAFCRELEAEGHPLPETRLCADAAALEAAARTLTFPVVVKPPRRSPEWMRATGGSKVLRIDEAESLLPRCVPLLSITTPLVLQSWVPGGDDCMYSVFVCLDRESRPAMPPVVVRKLRQWPPEIGVGSLSQQVEEPELAKLVLEILAARGFVGTGSMQFKRDAETGRFVVIEMNTRFALNFPICEECGVDATWIHCLLAAGQAIPEPPRITRPGGKWICWKRDLASAMVYRRRGELTVGAWLRSLRGRKRSADIMLRDPVPTLADVFGKLLGSR